MKYNTIDYDKTMRSALSYSEGFLKGVEQYQTYFNLQLAEIIKQAFYKYVDSVARLDPDSLQHVYEWGQVGVDGGRLFQIEAFTGRQSIRFVTEFQQSTSVSPTSTEPFYNKASVMEAGTMVTISPPAGGVLAFEGADGEMVFTPNEVQIDEPGGPEAAGGFAAVVRDFFYNYLDRGLLRQLIKELETPIEFSQGWNKGMNYSTGVRSARRYLTIDGGVG